MYERGDLDCVHEPFLYYQYVGLQYRQIPHFKVVADCPVSYEGVRDMLLERGENRPVFFKDMSFYAMPRILQDAEFCKRLTNCFLIRNPLASIPSYHKLDPGVTLLEIGIESQWHHFSALEQMLESPPIVIQSEDVRSNAEGALAALWERIGLDYCPGAFEWGDQHPGDWNKLEGWHVDVSASSSIRAVGSDEAETEAARFEQYAARHPHLSAFLTHHNKYYERLKRRALIV